MVKKNGAGRAMYERGEWPENIHEEFENMGAFNETLAKDGFKILDMGGLKPTSSATRIDFTDAKKPKTIDGPFAECKELVGGFWLLEAPSKEALVERLSHAPMPFGETLEIRPLFSEEDLAAIG